MLLAHRFPGDTLPAVLIARPNRFLAVCRLGTRTVEAHVPDRGRCLDLLVEGREVGLIAAGCRLPPRRTKFTAVLARSGSGTWVSLDPAGAPRLVEAALRTGLLPSLSGFEVLRREVAVRTPRFSGRIDLLLRGPATAMFCEVKSVGAQRHGIALFPDAPTERGVRHLSLLAALSRKGTPAGVVFCAQRGDVHAIAPDRDVDPPFAAALQRAMRAGVRVAGLRCAATLAGMELHGEVPVLLYPRAA